MVNKLEVGQYYRLEPIEFIGPRNYIKARCIFKVTQILGKEHYGEYNIKIVNFLNSNVNIDRACRWTVLSNDHHREFTIHKLTKAEKILFTEGIQ